eukprot:s1212_g8.t1
MIDDQMRSMSQDKSKGLSKETVVNSYIDPKHQQNALKDHKRVELHEVFCAGLVVAHDWDQVIINLDSLKRGAPAVFHERFRIGQEFATGHVKSWRSLRRFVTKLSRKSLRPAPFYSFKTALPTYLALYMGYGNYQNFDCHDMKTHLRNLDSTGSGRLPLKHSWFREYPSLVGYLHKLETFASFYPKSPSVVVTNFVDGSHNCAPEASPEELLRITAMSMSLGGSWRVLSQLHKGWRFWRDAVKADKNDDEQDYEDDDSHECGSIRSYSLTFVRLALLRCIVCATGGDRPAFKGLERFGHCLGTSGAYLAGQREDCFLVIASVRVWDHAPARPVKLCGRNFQAQGHSPTFVK